MSARARTQTRRRLVWLSDEVDQRIVKRAAKKGMGVSVWIRSVIMAALDAEDQAEGGGGNGSTGQSTVRIEHVATGTQATVHGHLIDH